MRRARCNVAACKQAALAQFGKKSVVDVAGMAISRPLRHRAHRSLRPITVIDFEPETGLREIRLDPLQRCRNIAPENALGNGIAGKRSPDEVVGARVTDVLNDGWVDITKIYKADRQSALGNGLIEGQYQRQRGGAR